MENRKLTVDSRENYALMNNKQPTLQKEAIEAQFKQAAQCCGGVNKPENKRRYTYTLSELSDRLSIVNLKAIFLKEHREEYAQEIEDIKHDIDLILKENNLNINADIVEALILIGHYNLLIWKNEAEFRKSGDKTGCDLSLSHSLNSVRSFSKNRIQEIIGGRKDLKLDSVKAHPSWVPPSYEKRYEKEI